jgi:hypothetical protein
MDKSENTLPRRQVLAIAAAMAAIPGAATAVLASPAKPSLEDPIFRLLDAHKAAQDRYGELALEEER